MQYTNIQDPLGSNATFAYGINNAGQIVGEYFDSNSGAEVGFLYSGGAYSTLSDPSAGAVFTIANGINNAGQIAGEYGTDTISGIGFLYSGGKYTDIQDPLGPNATFAFG